MQSKKHFHVTYFCDNSNMNIKGRFVVYWSLMLDILWVLTVTLASHTFLNSPT